MTPDIAALKDALERQQVVLAPISSRLRLDVVHPTVAPSDWNGPAATAYAELERRLRLRIRHAADAVDEALGTTRLALWQVAAIELIQVPNV